MSTALVNGVGLRYEIHGEGFPIVLLNGLGGNRKDWYEQVPVFWACGVTPQEAIANAGPPIAITHAPGHMFIADITSESTRINSSH